MARLGLKERGVNRVAVLVYGGGAVLLAPWIVVLALSQEQSTDGYRLRLSSLGMSVFIVAALVRAAITCRRQSPGVVVPASLAATFLFISGWFDTITAKHAPLAIALAYDVFVKLPAIVLAVWLALRMARDRGAHHSVPAWVPTAFVAATIVLVPWFVTVLRLIQRTSELHNLRLFWTGLDIFELVSMAATGWYLYRRSPYVAVSAMVTAALLLSDAWFNVVTTVHLAHRAALVMALVELPLAIYSVVIAGREVRSWPTAGAPNSSLCAETAMQHLRSIAAPNGGLACDVSPGSCHRAFSVPVLERGHDHGCHDRLPDWLCSSGWRRPGGRSRPEGLAAVDGGRPKRL
jgi:hypothetical protein